MTAAGKRRKQRAGARPGAADKFDLVLYISGAAPNSEQALTTVRGLCEKHLSGRYRLRVIDLYQQSDRQPAEGLTALPMLMKLSPPPARRLVGNFSSETEMLRSLGIPPRRAAARSSP